ncbi:MAG: hypothetical protein KC615_01745 [Anaerolineae bacterium]|nr:hypothetical protein [Anaerolineae bacterium]MCA9891674.1 hypothetical protein [Anaerolineae bacterium]MCB9461318.1 hypothetical protein [Anaerolineaceae bacterium]
MNWNYDQHKHYVHDRLERAKKQRQIDEVMRQEESPRRPIRRRRSGGSTI